MVHQIPEMSHVIATSFALGSSTQGSDPVNVGVGPLSNELYDGTHDHHALRLTPGEWSLVVIHPGPGGFPPVEDFQVIDKGLDLQDYACYSRRNKVYYAFVRCHGDYTDLSVHDLHGFLSGVGGKVADQLKVLSEGWPGFNFYDRGDITEALQKIYF